MSSGTDFDYFLPSSNLEGATVSSQFGRIDKGISVPMGTFEIEIVEGGYKLKMNHVETSKLRTGVYRFDVLVRRSDPLQKGGYRHDIEYFGTVMVG
ncbi:hypothetical protein EHO98_19380 [Leptospira stimsonii]|uniref:Uncharacterized protein n=1 Tax=Leptospira stimsonii TaxID=2202203 RepID=A0ABY2N5V4_9LEPT|nr:hypothetical protein EHO98_19380 [Leptospira stimsonii]TGM17455.1 hypothetical protein EHQ90_07010 [Leptospira stimsonii]